MLAQKEQEKLKMRFRLSIAIVLFCAEPATLCQNIVPLSSTQSLRAQSYEVLYNKLGYRQELLWHTATMWVTRNFGPYQES